MKNLLFLFFIFLSCVQKNETRQPKIVSKKWGNVNLQEKCEKADSILLVSHFYEITPDERIEGQKEKSNISIPKEIIIGDSINRKIIIEQKKILGEDLDSLFSILSLPASVAKINMVKCFEPHHSIIIFNRTKVYYIDLCFHCSMLTSSQDLNIFGFEQLKWEKLYTFFKLQGFKYKMNRD